MIFVIDIVTTTETQAAYPSNDSLLPNDDNTGFDSSGSWNSKISHDIEALVASLEMDYDVEGKKFD